MTDELKTRCFSVLNDLEYGEPSALIAAMNLIEDLMAEIKRLDLEGAYQEKMAYNATRHDHSLEARREKNGKKW